MGEERGRERNRVREKVVLVTGRKLFPDLLFSAYIKTNKIKECNFLKIKLHDGENQQLGLQRLSLQKRRKRCFVSNIKNIT